MKKSLFNSAVIILTIMFSFSACNNEEMVSPTPQVPKSPIEELNSEIMKLNNEKFATAQLVETRIPKWLRWLLTAVADVGVSVIPGSNIGYGVAASTLVWTVTKDEGSKSSGSSSIYGPHIALEHLNVAPTDNAGYIHNKVISDLYDTYGENLFELPIEQLISEVGHKVAEITGQKYITPSFTDEQKAIELLQTSTNLFKQSETIKQYFDGLKKISPSVAGELNVLQTTLEGYQYIDINTDKGEYAKEVIQLVNKANISDYSKQMIVSGVNVANASTRLWNTGSQLQLSGNQ